MRQYYYADENRQTIGPVSDADVVRLIRDGVLTPDSPLRAEGALRWETVRALVRRDARIASTYTPPRSTKICAHCGGRLSRNALWCATCRKSTLEHVGATLASPGKRLAAQLFDMMAPSVGTGVIARFISQGFDRFGFRPLSAAFLLAWAVWSMLLFSNGMTPGKWLLDIYVIDEAGDPAGFFRMLIREWIGKPISMFVFCLGYLWILIDQDNQGWHDKLVDTYVVED